MPPCQILAQFNLGCYEQLHSSFLTRRPEQLSIPEFVELTNRVAEDKSEG